MNFPAIRKKVNLFFSVFTLLFSIAYFSPSFSQNASYHNSAHAASFDAFVLQSGTALTSVHQHLYKITGLDYFISDLTSCVSTIKAVTSKGFFISLFERNVFYVFTTINAP